MIEWRVVKNEKELAEDVKEPNLVELKQQNKYIKV